MRRKKVLFITLIIVVFVFILGIVIHEFVPTKLISDSKNIIVARVVYHGAEISVDEDELINILNKYNAQRTLETMGPYESDKIDIEIDLVDNDKTKHILLGEFNIWYKSGGTVEYKILNAQQLKFELNSILE